MTSRLEKSTTVHWGDGSSNPSQSCRVCVTCWCSAAAASTLWRHLRVRLSFLSFALSPERMHLATKANVKAKGRSGDLLISGHSKQATKLDGWMEFVMKVKPHFYIKFICTSLWVMALVQFCHLRGGLGKNWAESPESKAPWWSCRLLSLGHQTPEQLPLLISRQQAAICRTVAVAHPHWMTFVLLIPLKEFFPLANHVNADGAMNGWMIAQDSFLLHLASCIYRWLCFCFTA